MALTIDAITGNLKLLVRSHSNLNETTWHAPDAEIKKKQHQNWYTT